ASICTTCDGTFNEKDYVLSMPDGEKVQQIFEELEFRRLKEQFLKLFSEEGASERVTQISNSETAKRTTSASAGSGQFSLFGNEGEASAEIKNYNSRATIEIGRASCRERV